MSVGQVWASELRSYEDPRTGVEVQQLTNYRAHSHHFILRIRVGMLTSKNCSFVQTVRTKPICLALT